MAGGIQAVGALFGKTSREQGSRSLLRMGLQSQKQPPTHMGEEGTQPLGQSRGTVKSQQTGNSESLSYASAVGGGDKEQEYAVGLAWPAAATPLYTSEKLQACVGGAAQN